MTQSNLSNETMSQEDINKLKMLVQSLKKKYGETVAQSYTLDARCKELISENNLLKETQNALSQKFNETLVELTHLQSEREKLLLEHSSSSLERDDFNNEVKALREQHADLLSSLQSQQEEAKKATDELQAVKLKETQLERVIQFLRKRSEEAQLETNQIAQELVQAQEHSHTLADELTKRAAETQTLKDQVNRLNSSHLEEREELAALRDQLQDLSLAFKGKSEALEELERQQETLKVSLESEKNRYETLFKEHIFLKQSMMRSVDEVKNELVNERGAIEEKLTAIKAEHENEVRHFEATIEVLKQEVALYQSKKAETEQILATKSLHDEEKRAQQLQIQELKDLMEGLKADKEEMEQRFKTAQQHLAKKVRETAVASERIEGERSKALDLQNQLNMASIKITELKNSLEMEAEHQRRALARESELLKNAELQISRLEEKVFQLHEKWKLAEAEAQNLKKIEEKWREAEKLFSQLGHFGSPMNKTFTPDVQEAPPSTIPSPTATINLEQTRPETTPEVTFQQPSFFEDKKHHSRFKETFL